MKKVFLLMTIMAVFVSGCTGTHMRNTMTSPTTYNIETDCK